MGRRRLAPHGPQLTGSAGGLTAAAAIVAVGLLTRVVPESAPALFGVVFLLACAASATWVQLDDAFTAPAAAPLAFAAGLLAAADVPNTMDGYLWNVVVALSLQAPWLFAGTLLSTLIASVRWGMRCTYDDA